MTTNTQLQNSQEYLDVGLRGQWYPVLSSWEVSSNPIGITRLEEQIVLWRDDKPPTSRT